VLLQEDVRGFGELALLFPLLFLGAAGLASWALLTRMVLAQRPVIGTLSASGAPASRLRHHYLGFGIVAALAGAIPGAIAGLGLAVLVARLYTRALSLPFTLVRLSPFTPLVAVLVAVITGWLAARGPARRATRVDPAEAMRGVVPAASGRKSVAERIVPALGRLGALGALVLRNIGRDRRRTATTALAVVLALTLVLTAWGMLDTVQVLTDRQFSTIERQDAVLVLDTADPAIVDRARVVPGVARIEASAVMPVVVVNGERRAVTSLRIFEGSTVMHAFHGASAAALATSGMVLGSALNRGLGLSPGETVDVAPLAGGPVAHERVAALVDEPLGTFAYMSRASAAPLLAGGNGATPEALVEYEAGADRTAVARHLQEVPGVVAVQDTETLATTVRAFLRLFYVLVGIMLAAGALLAAGLLYMGTTITLAQRTVELATMEAFGVRFRRLAGLVTAENLIVTAVALIPGVVAGWAMANAFMASFQTDEFSFPLTMRATTPVLAAAFVVVVAVLAQWPGIRRIRTIDVATIVRERAV
jgi:putative ABC transport system permease protein